MPVQPKKSEEKPSWVKDTSVHPSPVRKVTTPPPSTTKQGEIDVPWRKPNLRKTNPDPPPLLPDPPKPEPKPEWASKEKVILKPPPEKAVKIPITIEGKERNKAPPTQSPPSQKKLKSIPPPQSTNMANGKPPPPPPPPPSGSGPPPPPPPPGSGFGKPPIPSKIQTPEQAEKIEALRKMARRRPDPYKLMSEIQSGKKLKHVECNDRSRPIIPRMKSLGKFVFDSEAKPATKTDAIHNKLLNDIQQGVKLKKVVTNDRSKPVIQGLRKFRKQATIDDQKGSGSGTPEVSGTPTGFPLVLADEIDDIDILRDDLQSTKQMLELELQAKVQLGKVNQDLQCQIITLEAEMDKFKAQLGIIPENQVSAIVRRNSRAFKDLRKSKSGLYRSTSGIKKSKTGGGALDGPEPEEDIEEANELEEEVMALKGLVQLARTSAEDWEAKYKEASQKLLVAQGNLEDSEQKRVLLEKKLELAQRRKGLSAVNTIEKTTQTEEQVATPGDRRASKQMRGTSFCAGDSESEEESSDIELSEEELEKKKQERELKLWENKLKSFKEKQSASKTERKTLKTQQKKMEVELKEAKVRHKELQKEVDKMSKAMADDDDAEEEEEEEEDEEDEESSSEDEEDEEEAEESSSEEDDDSEAGHEERIGLYTKRVKRHENILNALRKGNYLLKANIDRLMDDLEEVRIRYLELEHELNTVLALA